MNKCLICFQDIHEGTSIFDYFITQDFLCGTCRSKMQTYEGRLMFQGYPMRALYLYDEFMESLLFQYKEGRDIALAPCFLFPYRKEIEKTYKEYTILYMPSSKQKNEERGFFALAESFKAINLEKADCFYKKRDFKQSSQKMDRAKIQEVIDIHPDKVPRKPLLLVDDVCTSGNTLLAALGLLEGHPYPIEILVMAVHPLFLKDHEVDLKRNDDFFKIPSLLFKKHKGTMVKVDRKESRK